MTDKPNHKQIQQACDLLNAASGIPNNYNPRHYGVNPDFTTLADTIAQLDAMQAERDEARAERAAANIRASELKLGFDKATADLAEIDRQCAMPGWGAEQLAVAMRAIAAPYRVETDPLVAEIGRLAAKHSVELSCEDVRSIASYFKPIGRQA